MLDTVEMHWARLRSEIRPANKAGSTVAIKFVITEEGKVSQLTSITTTGAETDATRACISALTDRAPFGQWSEQMKKVLGSKQEMTFTFHH